MEGKVNNRLVIIVARHGIRYPKKVPQGWPLHEEIKHESKASGALSKAGGNGVYNDKKN